MSIALWCVLIVGVLPYIAASVAKTGGGFDNTHPRDWLAGQEGYRRRANAAQLNSFEVFPLFAIAVIIAMAIRHAPQHRIDMFAMAFVAARVAYLVCYIGNWATLRSTAWTLGMICTVAIFVV